MLKGRLRLPFFMESLLLALTGYGMRSPYITPAGYQRLADELDHLLRFRRPEVTRAVSEAAAMGDRSENAEYIYGKKMLRELDRRIRFLQKRLPELTVITRLPDNPSKIYFGAEVSLERENGALLLVRIVGSDEFDPARQWISIDSPLAKALLGKSEGDEIRLNRVTAQFTVNLFTQINENAAFRLKNIPFTQKNLYYVTLFRGYCTSHSVANPYCLCLMTCDANFNIKFNDL